MTRTPALRTGLLLVIAAIPACGGGTGGVTGPVGTQLAFSVQPSTITAGGHLDPVVAVSIRDDNGVLVNRSSATVRLHLLAGGGDGLLLGTPNRAANSGVATFSDLSISEPGEYTLVAISGTLDSAVSTPFMVEAPPPPPASIEITVGTPSGGVQYKSLRNMSVNPAIDTLALHGTVVWGWAGGSHGVHSTGATSFVSSDTSSVVSHEYSLQFNTAGGYSYNCAIHANAMRGSILVK